MTAMFLIMAWRRTGDKPLSEAVFIMLYWRIYYLNELRKGNSYIWYITSRLICIFIKKKWIVQLIFMSDPFNIGGAEYNITIHFLCGFQWFYFYHYVVNCSYAMYGRLMGLIWMLPFALDIHWTMVYSNIINVCGWHLVQQPLEVKRLQGFICIVYDVALSLNIDKWNRTSTLELFTHRRRYINFGLYL